MEKKNYKISVCLASYNGEKYIKEQIESILVQLKPNDELVISDDYSTDNTLGIIKSLNDPRIKICHPLKKQPTKKLNYEEKLKRIFDNFQNAFWNSTGDLIFFSDQDDIWDKEKYRKIVDLSYEYDLIIHDALILSEDLNNKKSLFDLINVNVDKSSYFHTLRHNPYLGCTMAFSRSLGNLAFNTPYKAIPHDTWIALIAFICKFKIKVCQEPLIFHRLHGNNNSFCMKSPNPLHFKLKYRIQLLIRSILLKNRCFKK